MFRLLQSPAICGTSYCSLGENHQDLTCMRMQVSSGTNPRHSPLLDLLTRPDCTVFFPHLVWPQVTRATNAGSPARGFDRKMSLAAPFSAALSGLTWFNDMWRRFEQRKIHQPNPTKQPCLARLKGTPLPRGALIRPVFGKHYFLCDETKLHPFGQFSFAPPILGQKVH